MIVSTADAQKRAESSGNLINRLRSASQATHKSDSRHTKSMDLFTGKNGNTPIAAPPVPISNPTSDPRSIPNPVAIHNQLLVPDLYNPFKRNEEVEPEDTPSTALVPEVVSRNDVHVDDILSNVDSKIKLQQAHDKSLGLLVSAIDILKEKLDDVTPSKLPGVIAAVSKTVESIRREKIELNRDRGGREVHFHFYEPARKKLSEYEQVEA